ncbi:MAG: C10 family peptidase, partial [Bacteroidales bacterium]|nr:C10 family peptidase [Bacteroidales bacterium]
MKILRKALNITIGFVMFFLSSKAGPIDTTMAKEMAISFFSSLPDAPSLYRNSEPNIVYKTYYDENKEVKGNTVKTLIPCFYVFNMHPGFVVVSADDRATPILGFSTENDFNADDIPDNAQYFLNNYIKELKYVVDNEIETSPEIQEKWEELLIPKRSEIYRANVVVSPLIQTKWNQSPYYNQDCPYDNSRKCRAVTGCVATSIAQIIRYWEWPAMGNKSNSYNAYSFDDQNYGTTFLGNLSVNFGTTKYLYDLMPTSINWASDASFVNEVAKLSYHCGVATNMGYGCNGSGAYSENIPIAMINYFRYQCDGIFYQSNYSNSKWINMLKKDLDAGRPISYSGVDNEGYGHQFICDGYRDDNYFHFNWGWGGYDDGYFKISGTNALEYSNGQNAILGLEPDRDNTTCTISVEISNNAGQKGWGNGFITIYQGATAIKNITLPPTASSATHTIDVAEDSLHFEWNSGNKDAQCSFVIRDAQNNILFSGKGNSVSGKFYSINYACSDCPYPINLSAQSLTENSATINWTSGGSPTDYNLEYGYKGFSHGSGSLLNHVSSPITLSNLEPGYEYDVYVQANCDNGEISGWSFPLSIETLVNCDLNSTQTITNYAEQWLAKYLPICFQIPAYPYSYSQQIYSGSRLASLRLQKGYLSSIAFNTSQMPCSTLHDISIYLGHTDDEYFITGYVPESSLTKVYSGNWTFSNSGTNVWSEIPFQNQFKYDGESNIVVAVMSNSGAIPTSGDFTCHSIDTVNARALITVSDTKFTSQPIEYNYYSTDNNNIQFKLCPVCTKDYTFIDSTVCANTFPITVAGINFNDEGIKTITYSNAVGCDSIVAIAVKTDYGSNYSFNQTVCDSFVWNGSVFTASGDYVQNFQTVYGCDSIVTLHLTLNKSVETEFSAVDCDSFVWNGATFS